MPHDILQDLQKPTFSLITSFYPMPPDVQSIFITMLALYEQDPTPEKAALLFDKVMGKESPDAKKEWFYNQSHQVSLVHRRRMEEKYIRDKTAVPKGLPTSGNLLVGLGVVSRADKDLLVDAQAAARILNHLENPHHVHLVQELFSTDETGQVQEARQYLDKPFSTPFQRMEHLSAIMAGYQVVQEPYQRVSSEFGNGMGCTVPDITPALTEFHKAAIDTLYRVSEKLSPASQKVADKIRNLAEHQSPREEVKNWSFDEISKGMSSILSTLFIWHAPHLDKSKVNLCEDSYTPTERETVEKLIKKRITQVQTGLSLTRPNGKEYQK